MLSGDDESLAPRPRALARLATTLTAQPWALTAETVAQARGQGLSEEQIEAAIGVISMFNYFTRVADATGIEFDYQTPLPAFQPDRRQAVEPAARFVSSDRDMAGRPPLRHPPLRAAWESWHAYVLESDGPLSRRERRLLASVAAGEAGDWDGDTASGALGSDGQADGQLAEFARKLSRQPWLMEAGDLDGLRAVGYSDPALLHVISVVAHQNADSRLAAGLAAAGTA